MTTNGNAKLRAWRENHGKTQADVGDEIGVSPEAVARYESTSGSALSPGLLVAVQMELISGGDVALEDWGFGPEVFQALDRLCRARKRRARSKGDSPAGDE